MRIFFWYCSKFIVAVASLWTFPRPRSTKSRSNQERCTLDEANCQIEYCQPVALYLKRTYRWGEGVECKSGTRAFVCLPPMATHRLCLLSKPDQCRATCPRLLPPLVDTRPMSHVISVSDKARRMFFFFFFPYGERICALFCQLSSRESAGGEKKIARRRRARSDAAIDTIARK